MESDSKFESSGPQPPVESTSRRKIVTAAGTALLVSVLPRQIALAAYPTLTDIVPPVEGFFLIAPGKQGNGTSSDEAGDRIFFISSSWLPYFEVTDALSQPKSATVEISIGNPAIITWPSHELKDNERLIFSTTGNLPDGIQENGVYYVKRIGGSDDTFKIRPRPGGSFVDTTGNQSGTHTARKLDRLGEKVRRLSKLKGNLKKQTDWIVLYSDDISEHLVPNTAAPVVPFPDPKGNTYLAMSISPSL